MRESWESDPKSAFHVLARAKCCKVMGACSGRREFGGKNWPLVGTLGPTDGTAYSFIRRLSGASLRRNCGKRFRDSAFRRMPAVAENFEVSDFAGRGI